MLEKELEQKLVKAIKAKGGLCLKLTSPSMSGLPDRLCLLPDEKVGFVELKAPGKKPRPLQLKRHEQLRHLGFLVFVLDEETKIGGVIDAIQST